MRFRWSPLVLFFSVAIAAQAAAPDSIHWHADLESAKSMAKESGRLVLIHFWTPTCGPCAALEQNVFSQPGVAGAVEAVYVPVKLNADENTATAQWYGINRVPMDVVITPDGQLVGKMVSPPTAATYVAEVTGLSGKHAAKSGQAFAAAAAAAPVQPQINAAYANLQLTPTTSVPVAATAPTASSANDPIRGRNALAAAGAGLSAAHAAAPQTQAGFGPQTISNPAATAAPQAAAQPPAAQFTQAPVTPVPSQVSNSYYARSTPATTPPTAQAPVPTQPFAPPPPAAPVTSATAAVAPFVQAPISPAPSLAQPAAPVAQPVANGTPDLTKLPPGSPPLGFDGYCPVTMRNGWKWVAGNPQWGIVHRGRTYWFATAEEQKQFWTDPDRYTPALSGMDPVLVIDHQQQVAGKREHSLDYDGLFYMFASEATLQQFTANPQRYAAGVRQAMGIPRGRLVR